MRVTKYLFAIASLAHAEDHRYEHEYIEDGVIEDLTFGHHGSIWAKDHRHITGWRSDGKDYLPELHADRVVLTPTHPGNKRGAIWAMHPETHSEWDAEFSFRASGPHNGNGNLNFWYVMNPTMDVGVNSIYTVEKFNGIALVVSQFGNTGGTVRAFLNDGSLDFKGYGAVDELAFGQCNFPYRNLGKWSKISVRQTFWNFAVTVDGVECIKTQKIHLPHNYYFGMTAASSDPPDSFEVKSFLVHKLKEGKKIIQDHGHGKHPEAHEYSNEAEQWSHDASDWLHHAAEQGHGEPTQHETGSHSTGHADHGTTHYEHMDNNDWSWTPPSSEIKDKDASAFTSDAERFRDVHERLTAMYHQLDLLYHDITLLKQQQDDIQHLLKKVDIGVEYSKHAAEELKQTTGAIGSQELRDLLTNLHWALDENHSSLSEAIMKNNPRMKFFAFLVMASNVMLLGSYLIYRRRKDSQPKKYL